MKPAKFDYYAPSSIEEALELLVRYDGEARVLAGGQSLVPMMNFRLATPAAIVDLNRIASMNFIRQVGDAVLIGAMSDGWHAEFGADALRYALAVFSCLGLWSAVHFWLCGLHLKQGLAEAAHHIRIAQKRAVASAPAGTFEMTGRFR